MKCNKTAILFLEFRICSRLAQRGAYTDSQAGGFCLLDKRQSGRIRGELVLDYSEKKHQDTC